MGNHIDAQVPVGGKYLLADDSYTWVESGDTSANNGGETDYYRIDPSWSMAQDIIEARGMNYSQGNIFKAAFTFNTGRHAASTYERELNKIIYFAQRELDALKEN